MPRGISNAHDISDNMRRSFSAEFINTSLERLSDKVDGNFSSEIKIVKDVAAAGVLVWGIIFFILEAVIIIGKFI